MLATVWTAPAQFPALTRLSSFLLAGRVHIHRTSCKVPIPRKQCDHRVNVTAHLYLGRSTRSCKELLTLHSTLPPLHGYVIIGRCLLKHDNNFTLKLPKLIISQKAEPQTRIADTANKSYWEHSQGPSLASCPVHLRYNKEKAVNSIREESGAGNTITSRFLLVSLHYKNKSVHSMKNAHFKTKKSISITHPKRNFNLHFYANLNTTLAYFTFSSEEWDTVKPTIRPG